MITIRFFKIIVLNLYCLIKTHNKIYNPCNYSYSVTIYSSVRKNEMLFI